MDVSKYIDFLSQWPAHVAPGLPTLCALSLLTTGGLVVACKVLTFLRVILSLFVLPGKPVCTQCPHAMLVARLTITFPIAPLIRPPR